VTDHDNFHRFKSHGFCNYLLKHLLFENHAKYDRVGELTKTSLSTLRRSDKNKIIYTIDFIELYSTSITTPKPQKIHFY
jgi:hypothetical protein